MHRLLTFSVLENHCESFLKSCGPGGKKKKILAQRKLFSLIKIVCLRNCLIHLALENRVQLIVFAVKCITGVSESYSRMFVFPFNSSSRGEQISARRFGIICHRYLYRGSRKRPKKNASTRRVGQSQPLHSRKENKFSLKSSLLRFFSFSTRDSSLYTACN